ncbi:MAG: MgtC/SapB family protein [Firmicutes bacterium]|nr:MgtC/SapB family protein [Bacillota bacterium]
MGLREITYTSIVLRLLLALLCGGVIGLERGMKNRAAGMRTYMLVSVGACLVMLTNQYVYDQTLAGDPMRLGAQVVSGIGFLGAGTIVVTRHNQIRGLTTAAGLWSAAGVGLALGVGFYEAALVAAVVIFLILTVIQHWDDKMRSKTRQVDVYLEIADGMTLGSLIRKIRERDMEISNLALERNGALANGARGMVATIHLKNRRPHLEVLEAIREIDGVTYLEEL